MGVWLGTDPSEACFDPPLIRSTRKEVSHSPCTSGVPSLLFRCDMFLATVSVSVSTDGRGSSFSDRHGTMSTVFTGGSVYVFTVATVLTMSRHCVCSASEQAKTYVTLFSNFIRCSANRTSLLAVLHLFRYISERNYQRQNVQHPYFHPNSARPRATQGSHCVVCKDVFLVRTVRGLDMSWHHDEPVCDVQCC